MFFLLFIFLFACNEEENRFVKIDSGHSNISFQNKLTPTPELNILTYLYYFNGAGVAAADFNNDNLIDLYFVGNQVADKLYLNKGDFVFEDITNEAGIDNQSNWSTSVSYIDINQDGMLDIYICKIGGYKSIGGANLLYINQGIDENGIPHYQEDAGKYGLDLVGFSTQATFFDYDLDNDLDLFLLNHSVHPNRSYGRGSKRNVLDSFSGDRLLRNENGVFHDVSKESGIYQGVIGYGLDTSIGDVNNDGYPDVFVSNDFFENDYLYINKKNGTFEEVISKESKVLGHTSHYSMGNIITDLNNDGWTDIFQLDMLPEDLETYKTSGNDDSYSTYAYYLKNGYAPQYMQNSLHINNGNGSFSEEAQLLGIAATDWSWSVLGADFDKDGRKDLYVTNGIKGATNNMDFVNFIADREIQNQLNEGPTKESLKFANKLPAIKVANYAYRNRGGDKYEDVSKIWFDHRPSFSNGSTYADLDNDGDLDLVVNNVDAEAFIYENRLNPEKSYLKIQLNGPNGNMHGIGAKVIAYGQELMIMEENHVNSPYLSSLPPEIVIGTNVLSTIDSVMVIWPGGKYQMVENVKTNQVIQFAYTDADGNFYENLMDRNNDSIRYLLDFKHREEATLEFNRDPLIPFAKSNEGPKISVADINQDGFEDVYIGGGKWQSGALFIQDSLGGFEVMQKELFNDFSKNEETDHLFFDCDGDGDQDLIIVSGGNEFRSGKEITPRLYINKDNRFILDSLQFDSTFLHASVVKTIDLENDGDLDLLIGANAIPFQFGKTAQNYIFENDGKGQFTEITNSYGKSFMSCGLVEDIETVDLDGNGFEDLIIVGDWMPITIYYNNGVTFQSTKNEVEDSKGWWNVVKIHDFDQDGDMDIVAGNWGLNTRLSASAKQPISLYRNDFDKNGKIDPILTYYYQGEETLLATKEEIVNQIPYLNKRYLSFESFAKASLSDLFSEEAIRKAKINQVNELASCYFENLGNGKFKKMTLPRAAQVSTVNDIMIDDVNNDGYQDLLLVGNNYEIHTQLTRQDASHGVLLLNDQKGFFLESKLEVSVNGPARDIEKIKIADKEYWIITMNNDLPVFLEKK